MPMPGGDFLVEVKEFIRSQQRAGEAGPGLIGGEFLGGELGQHCGGRIRRLPANSNNVTGF